MPGSVQVCGRDQNLNPEKAKIPNNMTCYNSFKKESKNKNR